MNCRTTKKPTPPWRGPQSGLPPGNGGGEPEPRNGGGAKAYPLELAKE